MSPAPRPAGVGILPAGALGAAFFFHLTDSLRRIDGDVCFLDRADSASGRELREAGSVVIVRDGEPVRIPAGEVLLPGLVACAKSGRLPEVLLVVTQTDRLMQVVAEYVAMLETLHAAHGLEAAIARAPLLVLCSNGIFHQRVRRYLVEALEESSLFGRLPDLWAGDAMGRLVGRLLRGVTIQTGRREGAGRDAVYRPGPRGRTRLCGGDAAHRRRCGEILNTRGAGFEVEETASPTRVEFDKALVNLCGNLLGQLKAIDDTGAFRALRVREIFPEEDSPETRELVGHVVAIGRAVRAYADTEDFEDIYRAGMKAARGPLEHVPSSLQWIGEKLRDGTLEPRLTPTESWLVDPLIHYARTAGLADAELYLTTLIRTVEARLALAKARAAKGD